MRDLIFDTISDLVIDFLYYDRKEDEELGPGSIENAIKEGQITKEEIVKFFSDKLSERLE